MAVDHAIAGVTGRRFRGRRPMAYGALDALREAGSMKQSDFMEVYHVLGAARTSSGKQGSFLNNFRHYVRYAFHQAELDRIDAQGVDEWLRTMVSAAMAAHRAHPSGSWLDVNAVKLRYVRTLRDLRRRVIRVDAQFIDHGTTPNPAWVGFNVLHWLGPAAVAPDWRPDFLLPEDSYAL